MMCMCVRMDVAHATDYSEEGTITAMFSGAGNIVGVFHSGAWFNPANCPNGGIDRAYLIDYLSTENWNKVYAMLLTAKSLSIPVKIGVNPSSCFAGFPVIERVAIGKGY